MMKTSLLAVAMIAMASAGRVASAGGQAGSIGVGAEYQVSGLGGASINFDEGKFHFGGFLGYYDPQGANNSVVVVGGRFYYHVHSTAMSDFGLGGSLGFANVPAGGMPNNNRDTFVYLEPGFQIRLFLASNVALSFDGGLVLGLSDPRKDVGITAQGIGGSPPFDTVGFAGGAGVHYYFF
ncbi:MAG: hypothetical protein JO257_12025 [Deltaproteobacteria bacterium]|nr:hypothetical protein [Deltaproteobacteria bacterium]